MPASHRQTRPNDKWQILNCTEILWPRSNSKLAQETNKSSIALSWRGNYSLGVICSHSLVKETLWTKCRNSAIWLLLNWIRTCVSHLSSRCHMQVKQKLCHNFCWCSWRHSTQWTLAPVASKCAEGIVWLVRKWGDMDAWSQPHVMPGGSFQKRCLWLQASPVSRDLCLCAIRGFSSLAPVSSPCRMWRGGCVVHLCTTGLFSSKFDSEVPPPNNILDLQCLCISISFVPSLSKAISLHCIKLRPNDLEKNFIFSKGFDSFWHLRQEPFASLIFAHGDKGWRFRKFLACFDDVIKGYWGYQRTSDWFPIQLVARQGACMHAFFISTLLLFLLIRWIESFVLFLPKRNCAR